MDKRIFTKAHELIKASGSSFEALVTPFYSEEDGGVVIPTIMKVIPLHRPKDYDVTWKTAIDIAKEADMTLPTVEEFQHIRLWKDHINTLLDEHGGDQLHGYFWSCTEYSQTLAWYVNFSSGFTGYSGKYNTYCCRPLAAFKLQTITAGFDAGVIHFTMEGNTIKQITILEAIQMPRMEGLMVQEVLRLTPQEKKRLKKGYMLKSGIWSGDKLSKEFTKILELTSSEPSTVRSIISRVAFRAYEELKKELALSAITASQKK